MKADMLLLETALGCGLTAALAAAGFIGRMVIRWRIAAEFRRERRAIEPSPQSLYFSYITAERG
jgi:hypothetical protein